MGPHLHGSDRTEQLSTFKYHFPHFKKWDTNCLAECGQQRQGLCSLVPVSFHTYKWTHLPVCSDPAVHDVWPESAGSPTPLTVQGNWKSVRDGDRPGITRASGDASAPSLTPLPPAQLANTVQARMALVDRSCLGLLSTRGSGARLPGFASSTTCEFCHSQAV